MSVAEMSEHRAKQLPLLCWVLFQSNSSLQHIFIIKVDNSEGPDLLASKKPSDLYQRDISECSLVSVLKHKIF